MPVNPALKTCLLEVASKASNERAPHDNNKHRQARIDKAVVGAAFELARLAEAEQPGSFDAYEMSELLEAVCSELPMGNDLRQTALAAEFPRALMNDGFETPDELPLSRRGWLVASHRSDRAFENEVRQQTEELHAVDSLTRPRVLLGQVENFYRLRPDDRAFLGEMIETLTNHAATLASDDPEPEDSTHDEVGLFVRQDRALSLTAKHAQNKSVSAWFVAALNEVDVSIGDFHLTQILKNKEIAARALKHSGLHPSQFFSVYHQVLERLVLAEKTNHVVLHFPGKEKNPLSGFAEKVGATAKPFAVVTQLKTDKKMIESIIAIQAILGPAILPWLKPLTREGPAKREEMAAKLENAIRCELDDKHKKLIRRLKDAQEALQSINLELEVLSKQLTEESLSSATYNEDTRSLCEALKVEQEFLERVVSNGPEWLKSFEDGSRVAESLDYLKTIQNFRANGVTQIVGLSLEQSQLETTQELRSEVHNEVAGRVLFNHYYDHCSTPEGAFKVIGIGMGSALLIDHGVELSEKMGLMPISMASAAHLAVPMLVEAIDEGANAFQNWNENRHNIAKMKPGAERDALIKQNNHDAMGAVMVGVVSATGIGLAPVPHFGLPAIRIAQNPNLPAYVRGFAGAVYGFVTSGGGLYMAQVGGNRFRSSLEKQAQYGILEPEGYGRARARYYRTQGRKELLAYPAQFGTVLGAFGSMGLGFAAAASGVMCNVNSEGDDVSYLENIFRLSAFSITGGGEGLINASWQNARTRKENAAICRAVMQTLAKY